jgi:hypothetical protein
MQHLELGQDACPVTDVCLRLGTFVAACTTARMPARSGEAVSTSVDAQMESRLAAIEEDVARMRACLSSIVYLLDANT